MQLANLFKGMLLSQGYVATLRTLREVAPEVLPAVAPGDGAAAPADPGAPDGVDLEGSMPWSLAFAPTLRRKRGPASATVACAGTAACRA